jgi:hypothetical protein
MEVITQSETGFRSEVLVAVNIKTVVFSCLCLQDKRREPSRENVT